MSHMAIFFGLMFLVLIYIVNSMQDDAENIRQWRLEQERRALDDD